MNGQARSFNYQVIVFDPDQDVGSSVADALRPNVSATASVGQSVPVSFSGIPGAIDYQWRTIMFSPFAFTDGAESGMGNFTAVISPGYSVITTDANASGRNSFHLAHTLPVNQILGVKTPLVVTVNSALRFKSRLGLSSVIQTAKVEVSLDEGKNWQAIYQQSGQQSGNITSFGETSFVEKRVSMTQFANRTILLRFNYEKTQDGPFYPQSSTGIGWYIDDIIFDGFESQVFSGAPTDAISNSFRFVSNNPGDVLVQARAGMFGYYSDWGPLKRVSVGQQITTDGRDCIMNWAERTYPGTFLTSPSSISQSNAVYYFRYYAVNGSAIGFSKEDTVHYLPPGTNTVINIGAKAQWLMNSGCIS